MKQNGVGFSLIELLITLALGLVLLGMIMRIYLNHKQTYLYLHALARIQEHGRLTIDLLSQDVREAGFIGCVNANLSHLPSTGNKLLPSFDDKHFIFGIYGGGHGNNHLLPQGIAERIAKGTDALIVEKRSSSAASLLAPLNHKNEQSFAVTTTPKFAPHDHLIISDCSHAELLTIARVYPKKHQQLLTMTQPLMHTYANSANVAKPEAIIYFIGKTKRRNRAGQTIYALYRKDVYGPAHFQDEWVEGVRDLHIMYGVRQKSNAVLYLSAQQVAANNLWRDVVSVHAKLLLSSVEPIYRQAKAHSFNFFNQITTFSDRRMYKQWNVYIAVRARVAKMALS